MKKDYFHVKQNDSMPPQLPRDLVYKVDLESINDLALFATTLKCEPDISEVFGYASALFYYFKDNENDTRLDCYTKINSNGRGREFFCNTIHLFLLEKEFREKGISEDLIRCYEKSIKNYQELLRLNKVFHDFEQTDDKTR